MICTLGLTLYSFEFVFKRAKAKGNNGYQRFSQFQLVKVLYTAHAHTTGGREGRSVSDDGLLDVKLAPPKELGGMGGATNPEQLFAAGYSACFMGAMKHVAGMKKITVPTDASIDASIDIGPIPAGFGIAARLAISLPGMDRAVAEDLIEAAHQVCPYSNARSNPSCVFVLEEGTKQMKATKRECA